MTHILAQTLIHPDTSQRRVTTLGGLLSEILSEHLESSVPRALPSHYEAAIESALEAFTPRSRDWQSLYDAIHAALSLAPIAAAAPEQPTAPATAPEQTPALPQRALRPNEVRITVETTTHGTLAHVFPATNPNAIGSSVTDLLAALWGPFGRSLNPCPPNSCPPKPTPDPTTPAPGPATAAGRIVFMPNETPIYYNNKPAA